MVREVPDLIWDPAPGQHFEPFRAVRLLDDLQVDARQHPGKRLAERRPLVAAVGVEFAQERGQAEQARHQQDAAVAILQVGGMNDRVQQ